MIELIAVSVISALMVFNLHLGVKNGKEITKIRTKMDLLLNHNGIAAKEKQDGH